LSHPSGLFGGDYISALRGCLIPLKFSYALQIDQALIAHTQIYVDGVPPQKKLDRENFKFDLKFSVFVAITLGLVGVSSHPDDVMNFGPQTQTL